MEASGPGKRGPFTDIDGEQNYEFIQESQQPTPQLYMDSLLRKVEQIKRKKR